MFLPNNSLSAGVGAGDPSGKPLQGPWTAGTLGEDNLLSTPASEKFEVWGAAHHHTGGIQAGWGLWRDTPPLTYEHLCHSEAYSHSGHQ